MALRGGNPLEYRGLDGGLVDGISGPILQVLFLDEGTLVSGGRWHPVGMWRPVADAIGIPPQCWRGFISRNRRCLASALLPRLVICELRLVRHARIPAAEGRAANRGVLERMALFFAAAPPLMTVWDVQAERSARSISFTSGVSARRRADRLVRVGASTGWADRRLRSQGGLVFVRSNLRPIPFMPSPPSPAASLSPDRRMVPFETWNTGVNSGSSSSTVIAAPRPTVARPIQVAFLPETAARPGGWRRRRRSPGRRGLRR